MLVVFCTAAISNGLEAVESRSTLIAEIPCKSCTCLCREIPCYAPWKKTRLEESLNTSHYFLATPNCIPESEKEEEKKGN